MDKKEETWIQIFFTLIKGMLVGICDLIPGVSGGSILFIINIYERFVTGLKNISEFIKQFFLKLIKKNQTNYKKIFQLIDFKFFIPLVLGIWIILFFGSGIILHLMDLYPSQLYSFFIGLIISSTFVIYKSIGKKGLINNLIMIIGVWLGFMLSTLNLSSLLGNNFLSIYVTGVISIMAMMLPGISGSYLLIILGKYEFMLDVIHNLSTKYPYAIVFILGSVTGLLGFSKILSWLLKKYRANTLAFLTGIMFGAIYGPARFAIEGISSPNIAIISSILFLTGAILVIIISKLSKEK
ncbi:DUF368 domain-containing protein [Candidatus Woesearchaeota archaeon]|nr:DUF368 domain-containing protein [Candidatus Woesearchaeota archaeon]MCF7901028.1 DUF368 domain-containing protein [Candidatus Woesearchaeota archaeon]MCF8013391.1 DUF368 domain-containing protein [Candidatus Woesearchaeota archaeon]